MSTSYSNGSTMFVVVAALLTVGVSASPANAWEVASAGEVASHGVAVERVVVGWGVSGDGVDGWLGASVGRGQGVVEGLMFRASVFRV